MSIVDIKKIFNQCICLKRHRAGKGQRNPPLKESLDVMRETDGEGNPVSLVGQDIARLVEKYGVWVFYFPIKGRGATPWRGFIILDSAYCGKGQAKSSSRVATVAHEFSHVLQRRIDDPEFWPSGCIRANKYTRWACDSTNYMEVMSYIVDNAIRHELETNRLATEDVDATERRDINNTLRVLEKRLANLTNQDAENAKRYMLKTYGGPFFYEQNYRKERLTPGGRVPEGGWAYWLKKMKFSAETIEHIRELASRGRISEISEEEGDRLGKVVPGVGQRRVAYLSVLGIFGALSPLLRSIWESIVGSACSPSVCAVLTWIFWAVIGAAAYGLMLTQREGYRPKKKSRILILDWPSLVVIIALTTLLVHILYRNQFYMSIDLAVCGLMVDFANPAGGFLPIGAFFTGFFHQVMMDALSTSISKNTWQGIKEWLIAGYEFWREGVVGWKVILRRPKDGR
jgi:hypothetical protein